MESLPRAVWRLIQSPAATGALNMAIDEAILEAASQGLTPPTLRLYSWQPACLSLGYAQPVGDANRCELERRGLDLVRRPTGGRAILHIDELTYSVCGPVDEVRLRGGVLHSYRVLSSALLRALELLTINAQADAKGAGNQDGKSPNPVCFEVPSNYEITVNGKKLIGSAQARRKGGVLQHGSLPLKGDLSRVVQVLSFPNPGARKAATKRLLDRATTVERALALAEQNTPTWEQAAQAFIQAFQEILNLELISSPLTHTEQVRAQKLLVEKYANNNWTEKAN